MSITTICLDSMSHHFARARNPEDLTDAEVVRLRRLGFSAAMEVRRRDRDGSPARGVNRLEFLEIFVERAGVSDLLEQRFAVAQAAQFLAEPGVFREYVPEEGLKDAEWLRFMVEDLGASDTEIAFQIQRRSGKQTAPNVKAVKKAREALGLAANCGQHDEDTMALMEGVARTELSARHFLLNRSWLKTRVVDRDLSDGDIAKELARIGFPCDRSTVRLYRKTHGLRRRSYGG